MIEINTISAADTASGIELVETIRALPPMQRLFTIQELRALHDGEPSVIVGTPDEVRAAYDEWLAGFHPSVIDALESEKPGWEVRI